MRIPKSLRPTTSAAPSRSEAPLARDIDLVKRLKLALPRFFEQGFVRPPSRERPVFDARSGVFRAPGKTAVVRQPLIELPTSRGTTILVDPRRNRFWEASAPGPAGQREFVGPLSLPGQMFFPRKPYPVDLVRQLTEAAR